MKKDAALAHYNINPEAEIKGLDNAIGDIGSVADKHAATSNLVQVPSNQQTVQVKAESKFAEGDEDEDSTAENES